MKKLILLATLFSLAVRADYSTTKRITASDIIQGTKTFENYIKDSPPKSAVTRGWACYADAAGTSPVDGTGGSANVTWTASSTSPLKGPGSHIFTKGGSANRQGQGCSYNFTIDAQDKSKVLNLEFEYLVNSGTFVAGSPSTDSDVTVFIYDVTNGALVDSLSAKKLLSNSTTLSDTFNASFQTSSNSTSYRLIFHVASTSTADYTLKIGEISISRNNKTTTTLRGPVGSIIATGSVTPPAGYLYADGSAVSRTQYADLFAVIGTTYGSGDGSTTFNLPDARGIFLSGAGSQTISSITYTRTLGAIQGDQFQGHKHGFTRSGSLTLSNSDTGQIAPATTNDQGIGSGIQNPTTDGTNGTPRTGSETRPANLAVAYHICFSSGNVQLADSTDTRVVSFTGTITTLALTANTTNIPATTVKDSHSAWSSNQYTVPVPGDYNVSLFAYSVATGFVSQAYVNGTKVKSIGWHVVNAGGGGSTILPNLKAGDIISVRSNASLTLANDNDQNINIERISGPSAIAASELVTATARRASSSFTVGTSATKVQWNAENEDSHGAMDTTTNYRFTVPISGRYQNSGAISFPATASFTGGSILLYKNGTPIKTQVFMGSASVGSGSAFNFDDRAVAGDYYEIYISTNGASAGLLSDGTISGGSTWDVKRIGL